MRPRHGPIKGLNRVVGVDVAKATVVLFDSQTQRTCKVSNEPQALHRALSAFVDYDLMVCEVTGGYERAVLEAAANLGLPAHRADPMRVKRYIASLGGAAKTDGIDAGWLARYGQERGESLPLWRPRQAEHDHLASLVRHRQHLVAARTEAKNRRSAPGCEPIAGFLDDQIAFLGQQIRALDQAIEALIAKAPELSRRETCLRDITGFGPVVARSLIAFLPELGQLSRRQAASLAGLAPHPRDSGQLQGRRRTGKGRDGLKSILFMAALSASRANSSLSPFAQRLSVAGKPKRLVLTAVARKLVILANTRLRDQHAN
jgi:transposase